MLKKLAIVFIVLSCVIQSGEANMFNKFRKGFYFEKYKGEDKQKTILEVQNALLELHPIATDVKRLMKTLENAGAEFVLKVTRDDLKGKNIREEDYFVKGTSRSANTMYKYQYLSRIWVFSPIKWYVVFFSDDNNVITDLYVRREYIGI